MFVRALCPQLLIIALLVSPLLARAQDRRGPWGERPPSRSLAREVDSGFLFVNGEYVPPPYHLRLEGNVLLVNDFEVKTIAEPEPQSQPREADRGPRFGRPGRLPAGPSPARMAMQALVDRLSVDQMVIYLPGQPDVMIDSASARYDLLKELLHQEGETVQNVSFSYPLPPDLDPAVWNQWVLSFVPSEEFVSRATGVIELHDRTLAENLADIGATRRLHTFSYPLSVFGMLLTTIGMGHLLSQRPPVGSAPRDTDSTPLALRAAGYSLGLVVLFSALDLAWTLLASQAGQMRELNPLGSHLIDNPAGLIAFKVAATALAVGLLLALRKYKRAQLAAWWVCLICTLLTARWVMLNSMFIA